MKFNNLIALAFFVTVPYSSAAQIEPNDLSLLSKIANEQGAVRVAINIEPLRKLNASAEEKLAHAKRVALKTNLLKAELGMS